MIRLINNEYIKIGKIKLFLPFVLLSLFIIIKYIINKSFSESDILSLIPFIGIIICIMFCGMISNEIESGTLRYYLTKPISRKKVYFSKLFSTFIYIILLTLYILIIYFFINKSIYFKLIFKCFIYTTPIYFIASFAIMNSIFIKYTPINLGLCVFLLIFSGVISEFLFKNNIRFIQYLFFPYMDFSIFLSKESIDLINAEYSINLNIEYAFLINIIFIIIFNVIGYFSFIKKDIKS